MIKKKKILLVLAVIFLAFYFLSIKEIPARITYGVSFSKFHADELKLDWKPVFLALLNDLGIKNFRLSAHWPNTEPQDGKYNFSELDFQMRETQKKGASVILAVGRRLPGWPECHDPKWAAGLDSAAKQKRILEYIQTVVERYKDFSNLKYWQVENEPFLTFFSRANCGEPDEEFLKKEIELVRGLDPGRQILVTDSGEFGTWYQARRSGDVFGTSLYLYVWNRTLGPIRYPIIPAFFRIKQNIVDLIFGRKPSFVIELSAEPWLLQSIVKTPIDVQRERMGLDKFNEMINFASKTGFNTQYLWGGEWWYWMKDHGHPEYWSRAKEIFSSK